jgi:hypothetical protein
VAHLGAIMTQLGRALGARAALALRIDPLSLTRLSHGPEGWRAEAVNLCP